MIPIEANPFINCVEHICNTNNGGLYTSFNVICDGYVNYPKLHEWLFTYAAEKKDAPKLVIFNDPATVVYYDDGSKLVAKAKDGDEYDPLFGLMACALRKVGKNRVRIDSWEHVIEFLAESIGSADECRVLADMLNATADAWELKGVAESMDKWAEEQREEDEESASTFTVSPEGFCKVVNSEEVQEAVRQAVRDLMDRGEL